MLGWFIVEAVLRVRQNYMVLSRTQITLAMMGLLGLMMLLTVHAYNMLLVSRWGSLHKHIEDKKEPPS